MAVPESVARAIACSSQHISSPMFPEKEQRPLSIAPLRAGVDINPGLEHDVKSPVAESGLK